MKVTIRTRLNGRLPDPQGKYRDEITQEATIEIGNEEMLYDDESLEVVVAGAEKEMKLIKARFYAELARLEGKNYQESD